MATRSGHVKTSAEWPVPGDPGLQLPLVVSSYTLGTAVPFADRVRAAAAAGFDGIGLRAENYWDAERSGLDGAAMAELAAAAGVPVLEVEYITAWGTEADRDDDQRRKEQTVFSMARTFGVKHLNTGLIEKLPVDVIIEAFTALCDRAGDDLTIALEFMPYSGVPDLATAWQILRDADRPNSALIVDVWHWARAGMAVGDLAVVPADRIVAVQLCDVRETPMEPMRTESLGHRLPPGAGYGDAIGLVRALRNHGVRPDIIAVEVISDELVGRGVESAAQTVAAAARDVLSRSGGPRS
jgi:sugar phosphate isomerase/epimerase